MTLQSNITDILNSTGSKKNKIASFIALVADERRDFAYRMWDVDKSHGPKWVEDITKMAQRQEFERRDTDEHEEGQI